MSENAYNQRPSESMKELRLESNENRDVNNPNRKPILSPKNREEENPPEKTGSSILDREAQLQREQEAAAQKKSVLDSMADLRRDSNQ